MALDIEDWHLVGDRQKRQFQGSVMDPMVVVSRASGEFT